MKNILRIKRECWPEVIEIPHFIVGLQYESLAYSCDDIYFEDLSGIASELLELEKTRKGKVTLHGGFRFEIIMQATPSGGIDLNFKTETDANFPGKYVLEGFFQVAGEHTPTTIGAFTRLFNKGEEFILESDGQFRSPLGGLNR